MLEQSDCVFRRVLEEALRGEHHGLIGEIGQPVLEAFEFLEQEGLVLGVLLDKLENPFFCRFILLIAEDVKAEGQPVQRWL